MIGSQKTHPAPPPPAPPLPVCVGPLNAMGSTHTPSTVAVRSQKRTLHWSLTPSWMEVWLLADCEVKEWNCVRLAGPGGEALVLGERMQ